MKTISKLLSLALACVLTFGCATTAFAAESNPEDVNNNEYTVVEQEIPVVFEGTGDEGNASIVPMAQGDQEDFRLGSIGYLSNCGRTPKFKCWVTGGSSSTQVMFRFKTGGGVNYGPFGPVTADGSEALYKSFIVFDSDDAWEFTAFVSSGPNNGNLVCHVQQY